VSRRLLILGVVGLGACLLGALVNPAQFFRSYLVAYLFWLGCALGCLPIMLLHNLSGGGWGHVIRRALESGLRTLPLLALLFLPLVFGLGHLYVWARPEAVAADALLRHKSAYLNVPFFLARAVVYFAVWIGAARLLERVAVDRSVPPDDPAAQRVRVVSGPCLALYGATMTFAAIDWAMSLEPHWQSTMFPLIVVGGQVLAAFGLVVAATIAVARRERLAAAVDPGLWQDLGNLLLAFIMLWAYFSFAQYLIVWSGNLAEEVPWYLHRLGHGYATLAVALVLLQFVVPFLALLSRDLKRSTGMLGAVAGLVVCLRFVDLFWLIVPEFHPGGLRVHWMDVAAPVGLGGLWLAAFSAQLGRKPVLQDALAHGTH
jgi:hypothetical protein